MAEVSGGQKLEAALAAISSKLKRGGQVKVGFLSNAKYPDGTPVAMIAAIQDFGAPSRGIPPRPFFRTMVAKEQAGWPAEIAKDLVRTNYDVDQTLGRMGALIAGQLRESIVNTNEPALKPATIARKGSDKPLIDTGHMFQSVDFKVDTK